MDVFMDGLGRKNPSVNGTPMFLGVIWESKVITIETWREAKGDRYKPGGVVEYRWQIERIKVPLSWADTSTQTIVTKGPVPSPLREEVLDLVRECMIELSIQTYKAKSVYFDCIAEPYYYERSLFSVEALEKRRQTVLEATKKRENSRRLRKLLKYVTILLKYVAMYAIAFALIIFEEHPSREQLVFIVPIVIVGVPILNAILDAIISSVIDKNYDKYYRR
ncbi:MAG: hypothetical protein LBL37_09245 [Gracilibacteraceae bacterium]|jgi:hypothetical protein|nr:hypothetical protein [Gracilibacteraceae bacterium]